MKRTHIKERLDAPTGFFACEAAGLDWLRVDGGPQVARATSVGATRLELEFIDSVPPSHEAAHNFGRRLSRLHQTPAPSFGSVPPNWDGEWFFGPLHRVFSIPVTEVGAWSEFFVSARLEPLREMLRAGGHLDESLDVRLTQLGERVEARQPYAGSNAVRVHGDLWSGNVIWSPTGVVLIDPAAHGNHPYTDLAMLELFGCPLLDEIFSGYFEESNLAKPGATDIALHQIFPIGMHVVIFGSGYRPHLDDLLVRALDLDI